MDGHKSGLFPIRESHIYFLMNSAFYGCRVAEVSAIFLNIEMNLFVLFFKSFLLEKNSYLQVVLIYAAKGEDEDQCP